MIPYHARMNLERIAVVVTSGPIDSGGDLLTRLVHARFPRAVYGYCSKL